MFLIGRSRGGNNNKYLNSPLPAEAEWSKVFNHFPTSTIFWPTPAPCPEAGEQAAAPGHGQHRQLKAQAGGVLLAPGASVARGITDLLPLGWGPGAGSQQPALEQSRASHHSYSMRPFGFAALGSGRSTLAMPRESW